MDRLAFFIDGFNLYHALQDDPVLKTCKWLDYHKLTRILYPSGDRKVIFFTALPPWDQEKKVRHEAYLRVLRSRGVQVVLGKFKHRFRTCRECGQKSRSYEEKMTDVNIATHLFRLAVEDEYDVAVLVSGDTDLVPAIEAVKSTFPHKEVHALLPPGDRGRDGALSNK